MNSTNRVTPPPRTSTSEGNHQFMLDYKKLLFDAISYWWLFAISIFLAFGVAYAIHRYSNPIYMATARLLMEERGTEIPQSNMMEGFGLTPGQRNLDNQIAVLTSRNTVRKTIDQLNFNLSYVAAGRLKDTELYPNPPFIVHFDPAAYQLLGTPIYLTAVDSAHFMLSVQTDDITTIHYPEGAIQRAFGSLDFKKQYSYNEWVDLPWLRIKIENKGVTLTDERSYFFMFHDPEKLTSYYSTLLSAVKANENSSIVNISVTGPNHQKNIDFLNALTSVFINANLDKKNQIATNTIRFIEEQLITISDSLAQKGAQLSTFRAKNQIQSVSSEAQLLLTHITELNNALSEKMLIRNYYNYLTTYFSNDSVLTRGVAPAVYPIDNPIIGSQINNILTLNNERLTLGGNRNPFVEELDKQLKVAVNTLLEAIRNQTGIVENALERLGEERAEVERRLYQLPETERQLLGIERQFDLNNEVYTFLLRKRSESQIQKASNTSDHSVLEAPHFAGQVSPQTKANNQKALFIGLLFPLLFIVLKQLLNTRIISSDEIEKLTTMPLIGHIMHNNKGENNVVISHPRSVITETFRRVRSRLEYMTSGEGSPIISVSSSMPGEGKTFCAINLAAVFALTGKKTILVGFDMRKPGLNKIIDYQDKPGLSQYLINAVTLEDVIQKSEQPSLDILPAGEIPPNPSELIGSKKTDELLSILKKRYDVIILDTPPMGVVADAYLLARKSDTLIFLARQSYTIREAFVQTIRQMSQEGITNIGVLFNDISLKKGKKGYGYGYRYGYGYGYGYGYEHGYYED